MMKAVAMLSAWSSTVIILSGKKGSLVALASVIGGYYIMRLESTEEDTISGNARLLNFLPLAVTQWNLLAVCLFFAMGHWCTFDGLRYGAAFIGLMSSSLFIKHSFSQLKLLSFLSFFLCLDFHFLFCTKIHQARPTVGKVLFFHGCLRCI